MRYKRTSRTKEVRLAQLTPITVRVPPASRAELGRIARRLGVTPSETGARFIEEGIRQDRFPQIEFRNTEVGRQAFLKGTRLSVFFVARTLREFDGSLDALAEHLSRPRSILETASAYAEAFPDEVENAIRDYESLNSLERLRESLPGLEVFDAGKV